MSLYFLPEIAGKRYRKGFRVITCISTSTRIAKNHIPIQKKTISQKPYPVASKSKNRVPKSEVQKTESEKPCPEIRSQKNRAQKSEARKTVRRNPKPAQESLKIRLPKTIPFSDPVFCPDFLGTVLRIRFFGSWLSGQGFLDTVSSALVFGIRFFGHGCLGGKIWFLHHKIPIRSPRQPYPKNRIRKPEPKKNRIQKTLSRKPGPKKPYPESRHKKTGSEKGGFWGWFLRRSDTEYGFWYTDI